MSPSDQLLNKLATMAVDFCDYFWGEKHDGFHVLYQNMKSGLTATKDLTDIVRETALMQENNSKVTKCEENFVEFIIFSFVSGLY